MDATTTVLPTLTAHLTSGPTTPEPTSDAPHINPEEIHLSRDQVPWRPDVWERIDRAVAHEVRRTRKCTRFMPQLRVAHHFTNVEQDVVLQNLIPGSAPFIPPRQALAANATPPTLNVYEGAYLSIIELSVQWALTHAQVKKENEQHQEAQSAPDVHPGLADPSKHHSTAVLLARRVANTMCLGVDGLIWLGSNAFPAAGAGGIPLFSSQTVLFNGVPADTGLTCIGGPNTPLEVLAVEPANIVAAGGTPIPALYSTNTVAQIFRAVTDLAANGYGGPYAAALPPYFYAESFFPLGNTLQRPADLIIPLLDAGYHDSAVLPGVPNPVTPNPGGNPLQLSTLTNPSAQGVGFVLSLGGDVVQYVNSLDPVTACSQIDGKGNYIMLLKTRVALKISDANALVRLEFI
jgi:hypothetical protein